MHTTYMKKTVLITILLCCVTASLSAQTLREEMQKQKDREKSGTLKFTEQKDLDQNDVYFNEISLKYGTFHLEKQETELYELTATRYFTPNWGAKIGITQIKNIGNMRQALQLPLMVSLRSTPFTTKVETGRLTDLLWSIFSVIPLQIDVSAGVAMGCLTSDYEPRSEEQYYLNNRFMASLRADATLTLYIWRIGVNASVSGQYFLTPNFKKYQPNIYNPDHDKVARGVFSPSIGIVYRF